MTRYGHAAKDLRHRIALTDQKLHDKRAELGIVKALGKPPEQIANVRGQIDDLLELRHTLDAQLQLLS